MRLKLYGERNTGTRYLQQLIRLNLYGELVPGSEPEYLWRWFGGPSARPYELACDLYFALNFRKTLGWKHMLVPAPEALAAVAPDTLFVTLTKNPYAWLFSLFASPYHACSRYADFPEFLQAPWPTRRRERAPRRFANPMELWNWKNRAYLRLPGTVPVINLRYEDLLADPERCVREIAVRGNLAWRQAFFKNRERSTKAAPGRDFAFYRDYYLGEQWRARLGRRELDLINAALDPGLVRQFGYSIMEDI